MSRRVLLCWESGAGGGHIAPLLRLAKALRMRGVLVDIAAQRLTWQSADWVYVERLFQAPVPETFFGGARQPTGRQGGSRGRSHTDTFYAVGFDKPEVLTGQLRAWRSLFDAVRPDFVVGDFSPGALLAARGKIPAASFGIPFCTPVARDGRFPDYDPAEPEGQEPAQRLLDSVNMSLAAIGEGPVASVPEAFVPERRFAFGFAEFDPFAGIRTEALLPPGIENATSEPGGGDQVHVILTPQLKNDPVVVAALIGSDRIIRMDDSGLDDEPRQFYQERGTVIDTQGIGTDELARSGLVLFGHGGVNTVMRGLMAGVPQLVLPFHTEQEWNGRIIEKLGVGLMVRPAERTVPKIREALDRVIEEPSFAERAAALAPEFRRRRAVGEMPDMVAEQVHAAIG